jgi:polar amino acid transport system substrate-binding protein
MLAAGVILAAGGCATSGDRDADSGATNAPLRVGITPNMPPLIYKQGRDTIGLEVDLANDLGRELGRPVRFVELRWDDQITALTQKKTDIIMSGMSVTKLRSMRIAFTDSYLEVGQLALVRRSDLERFYNRAAILLCSERVGVEKGTTGDLLVQQAFINAKRAVYSSSQAAVKDLINARIDMAIHDAPVVWWEASVHESDGIAVANVPLTTEYLAWGVREDDPAFLKAVNGILARWVQEGKLQGAVKRWIPYAR